MPSTPQTTMIRAALGSASVALAQRGPGMGARMYDFSTVETVRGVVTVVDTVTSTRQRQHRGLHLQLKTAGGDVLTVHRGSRVTPGSAPSNR